MPNDKTNKLNELVHKIDNLAIRLSVYFKRNRTVAEDPKTPYLKGKLAKARSESYLVCLTMIREVQALAKGLRDAKPVSTRNRK